MQIFIFLFFWYRQLNSRPVLASQVLCHGAKSLALRVLFLCLVCVFLCVVILWVQVVKLPIVQNFAFGWNPYNFTGVEPNFIFPRLKFLYNRSNVSVELQIMEALGEIEAFLSFILGQKEAVLGIALLEASLFYLTEVQSLSSCCLLSSGAIRPAECLSVSQHQPPIVWKQHLVPSSVSPGKFHPSHLKWCILKLLYLLLK